MSIVRRMRPGMAVWLIATAFLLGGCATPPRPAQIGGMPADHWEGRMSLQIRGDQPQGFSAGFALSGNAEKGELKLATPLGTVLGVARWAPGEAVLLSGNDTRRFASVDALLEQTTGASVPLAALFDWLDGRNTTLSGWQADLSDQPAGKITARRTDPAPVADLRIVLDQ
ncbi:MAG: lipoprotein insertase outer membrane protein LolB [Polaromonas sp.]|nr:lipoprotein insertase outer membrane protein LolB [Polaromonas sp.]